MKELKFDGYVECSALEGGDKLDEVFQTAVRLSLIKLGMIEDPNEKHESEERNHRLKNIKERCCIC